jgi:UDP-GlcNAc:undecaprenyl-phosphate/decaprenyl-phosphate GlcNAc-1-phosphate transferase
MRFGSIMPFIEALTVCLFLTPLIRWMGIRLGIVDQPDQYRKFHTGAIPRCGGLAIYVSFLIPIFVFFFFIKKESHLPSADHYRVWIIVIGSGIAMLMGLADDIWNIRVRWKILFQIIAATVAYSGNLRIESLTNPFGSPIELGFFSYPATLIWFFVCMNAINIFDGLDGLAAGVSLFVTLTLLAVSLVFGNDTGVFISACLSGAILGFLVYNFNPATIFMGDSGSMFIGFGIAALGLVSSYKAEAATALLVPIIALLLPFFDLVSAALRRWSKYLPMTMPDGKHLHHVMMSKGLSARRTVVYLYFVCLVLCAAALMIVFSRNTATAAIVTCIGAVFIIGNHFLKVVDVSEIRKRITHDRQLHQWNKKYATKLAKITDQVKASDDLSQAWEHSSKAFASLKLLDANLEEYSNGKWHILHEWNSVSNQELKESLKVYSPWVWTVECPLQIIESKRQVVIKLQGKNESGEIRSILPFIKNLTLGFADKF